MASEMVTVRMCRGDLSTSWGFCLEHPGVINQIVGGSLADRAGLQNGDILDEIQGERSPSLSSALRLLDQAKYEIELVVLRDPAASRVWRPKITAEDVVISKFQHSVHNVPPSAPPIATAPPIPPVVKVSLEHQPPPTVQVPGFNATPKVFSPAMETNGRGPTYPTSSVVSHHAENSSYSKNTNDSNLVYANKAEKYLMETGGLFGTDPKVVQAREKGGFVNSETLKLIQEEEKYRGSRRDPVPKNPDAITSREPNAGQGLPHCFICDRSILGLMCKVFDVTLHPDCFQCATCGTSLRNQGHHFLNDKFYCDVHGRQRKAQLGAATSLGKAFEKVSLHQDGRLTAAKPVLDPDLAVKTPPTAAHPVRVPEPPKAAYQPSVMTTQPLLQEKNQTRSQDEPRVVPISIHQENGHKTNGYQHRHTDSALSINTKDSNLTSPLTHTSTTSTVQSSPVPNRSQLSPEIRKATTFNRKPSGRLPRWPPTGTIEEKRTEAIRYWKITPEPTELRDKKSLQELIHEENHKPQEARSRSPPRKSYASSGPLKATTKRVVPTPHRLLKPMRNPYVVVEQAKEPSATEKEKTGRLSVTFSEPETKSRTISPAGTQNSTTRPDTSEASKSSGRRSADIKTPETSDGEEWRSEIVEEKDLLTDVSSFRKSDDEATNADDDIHLPQFDQKTSEFLKEQGKLIYDESSDEMYEVENKSSSTPKDSPSESSQRFEEKDMWTKEVEQAKKNRTLSQDQERQHLQELEEYAKKLEQEGRRSKSPYRANEIDNPSPKPYKMLEQERAPIIKQQSHGSEHELESERQAAIQIIEQHQKNLQEQQEKLSALLDNAIRCLKNLDSSGHQNILNNNNTEANQEDDLEAHNTTKTPSPTKESIMPLRNSPFARNDSRISAIEDDEIQKIVVDTQDSPPTRIVRALHKLEPNPLLSHQENICVCPSPEHKKVSTYEHSKKEDRFVSPSEPPREHHSSMSGNMDGVRQRGTLMTQTTRVPVCEQCKQPIRGPFVLAAGLTWCPEHFKCANSTCERRLLDTGFVEENGQKYCEKCFETLIAPICNKCGTPITADCLTALQKQWHPECFVCAHCRRPFGNSAFYLENGQPYYWNSLFTTKCIACKFPIEAGDRWVEAMGSAFHSNCFNCAVCQSNLEGQSFYAKNGLPFCRIHA